MSQLRQTISKLYFGKWPFKIKISVSGAWMVKRKGVLATLLMCKDPDYRAAYQYRNIDFTRLEAFTRAINPFLDKDMNVRVEGGIFSIYCKDPNLFEDISKACAEYIVAEYAPSNDIELEYMNNNSAKKVLCNHIPFNRYPYKVYVKYNTPLNTRSAFKKWSENYYGKIKPSSTAYNWMNGVNSYNALIFYIEDQPTLSMIGMFLGSYVAKVEEFIPRSSINTRLEQEETCQL